MSSNQNPQSPIHRAVLEMPHHSFEAYGMTLADAKAALETGLKAYGIQYGLGENWYAAFSISNKAVELGQAYLDVLPALKNGDSYC